MGKAALNGYFKEAHAPRWVVISGCQLMGLLSLVTTVPCQDTHGWLSRPRKVFQCQQLPLGPRSPETGLSGVRRLGLLQTGDVWGFLQGRGKVGVLWGFCREEKRRGYSGAGDVGRQAGLRQGLAGGQRV